MTVLRPSLAFWETKEDGYFELGNRGKMTKCLRNKATKTILGSKKLGTSLKVNWAGNKGTKL